MNNQVIRFGVDEADRYAPDYFLNICGFKNREGDKYKRMLEHGMKIREKVVGHLDMKAVVSSFDGGVISGNAAKVGNVEFICNAFEQLKREHIRRIYVYLYTSGNLELNDEDPVIDQLYADIWGTAYTDAGLEVLKHHILDDFQTNCSGGDNSDNCGEASILDPFGPGFYGMDVDQIGMFFEVLDGDQIGVRARTNSLMLPLKSCAGFFVIVDDGFKLPLSDCKSCRADHKGCEYCQARIKST
jgi:hypothetical protein